MIKAPTDLQELRRRIYRKTKSDKSHRFWGSLCISRRWKPSKSPTVSPREIVEPPGIDRQSFADVEASGLDAFLAEIREETRIR
jgi:RNA-directed DNA polymerase